MAELTAPERPFPPGRYPALVIGSGPGGLQVSYALTRLGVRHAVLSADDAPGGMFRRWPFFQRLLSWTKPFAPVERGSRAYERYDWNSLLADEPALRALQPELMDGSSYFPARHEMEENLAAFATRASIAVRYGTRWTGTRQGVDGEGFVVETSDGEYETGVLVLAVGVAEPFTPPTPGLELAAHYADTRPAESYAGRRVLIVGKQNSGFELASGFLPWARRIVLVSPSQTKLSVDTKSLVGVRARYVQPYEDHVLGGGVSVLDGSIERVERMGDGTFLVHIKRRDGGPDLAIEADEVIAATGFTAPLLDLPELGVATFGQSRLPAQTPFWESATVPGIYFAGTIGQGAAGLKKHGLPSNSGAVHGARYNARVLARHVAEARFGLPRERPLVAPRALVDTIVECLAAGPELWHQKAYLARVLTIDPAAGILDDGILPLAHVLDADGPPAIVATLEADGAGSIYPVIYVRRPDGTKEHVLESHPLHDFASVAYRRQIAEIAHEVAGVAVG